MPPHHGEHTGARIKRSRKVRRLTQRELAELSNVSYSTLTKVEQGALPASPSVVGALARALSVSVAELNGQPYFEELRQDQLDGLIQPIREALNVYDLGPDPDVVPRPVEELETCAGRLCALVRAANVKQAAADLPGLILEATTTVHTAGSDRSWRLLASMYRTAYDVTTKLSCPDLGMVALDRMGWAAECASDPVLGAVRQYMRGVAYLRAGDYRTGRRLVQLGMAALEQAEPGRERDVATGQLHLGSAVLAGRGNDEATAGAHLEEAQRIADRTGPAEGVHWLSFGPTNVGVHRVSVLAELGQYADAVRAAEKTRIPDGWIPSRLAHHYAEVAQALMWTGRAEAAFKNLQKARKLAPQQTRYHALVRETYAGLESAKRRMPSTFCNFGAWLGA
ncbi:transcriptional regulator [Streptomyces cinnamoneus]|uniref:Transcriptional regulator n=1 Tax=Streptomyces cinnamoneus TaxID=53446 RepID=A0A2G1XL60_STRCJ|nr:helix-turn-helix domain-containing protein [Streptomyces cinnamoneus]PHQ51344.1 transcriptional regulator [Streptomyces cinnamoneus]PHQ51978.1 transcriptional regulator [Streptomyces cinnamoneus]PHQ51979.1 transcriptional regulator [Streptomyces cinnamoneus]PPT13707.1 helix-turn-helix domain-containing protein [Streptomyces cinnamoneus]